MRTLDDYVLDYIPRAVQATREAAGAELIRCPVLSVGGAKDAVAPPSQTQTITELVSSQERQRIVLDAGISACWSAPSRGG